MEVLEILKNKQVITQGDIYLYQTQYSYLYVLTESKKFDQLETPLKITTNSKINGCENQDIFVVLQANGTGSALSSSNTNTF